MDSFLKNKFFVVMAVIALFLLGFMGYAFSKRETTLPDNISGTVITPVQKGAENIFSFFGNFVEKFTQYNKVKAENEQLKKQLQEYETAAAQNEAFKSENEQLKGILGIKEANPDYEFVAANVVAKDPGDWFAVFTIDKGTLDGIKAGCPVITPEGLAGRVKEVGLTWAKVVSVIDTECVVGAIIIRTQDAGIVEGDLELSQKGLCKLTYIDNAVSVNRGDIIDTSGLGGIFPKGFRIGRVEDILPEPHGISQYAVIRPSADFDKLKQVFVIKNFNSQNDYLTEVGGSSNAK